LPPDRPRAACASLASPALAVRSAVDAEVFEAYLERILLPDLCPGRIVMMDNLSAHKSERVRELIEGAGCELIYLPRPATLMPTSGMIRTTIWFCPRR
jgi:hypothetical protein